MSQLGKNIRVFFQRAAQTGRMMVGVGDYDNYLAHMAAHHPEQTPMAQRDYFRYCQQARYPQKPGDGGKISRCPC